MPAHHHLLLGPCFKVPQKAIDPLTVIALPENWKSDLYSILNISTETQELLNAHGAFVSEALNANSDLKIKH